MTCSAVSGGRSTFLDRELARWTGEMERVQRGSLPALERLAQELRSAKPGPCPRITLVHSDPRPGKCAFVGEQMSSAFDWELADVGDPLADVGYLESGPIFPRPERIDRAQGPSAGRHWATFSSPTRTTR